MRFRDRRDAGRRLAAALSGLRGEDVVVLALPRGGVPVAYEVACALGAPLDVIVVRKLGVPYQPELGMGAIGEGGVRIVNDAIVRAAGVTQGQLAEVERREREELERRARRFRGDRPAVPVAGRTALIVDDGIATGSTARAACQVARAHGARRVVLAAPVAPPDTVARLRGDADELVCLEQPEPFHAIGQWYDDFSQTTDAEVVELLERAAPDVPGAGRDPRDPPAPARAEPAGQREVVVDAGGTPLPGTLAVPPGAGGVVLFAHGSGSSRLSPRNRYVAGVLHRAGLATLLFDLLTPAEERDRANVFDVGRLGSRLAAATAWVRTGGGLPGAHVGYFGASTGAAAALWAAADPATDVRAVVSRGGRPDLAGPRLAEVRAPTLLVVGGRDEVVLHLNEQARARMRSAPVELVVVPGASHLFEEPGALERVAVLAADWFARHLGAGRDPG
ncbi:MAG: putative phosphoribosyl transferase [Acidimicrobiia bacterium]|nr:MAG: putative phosphoribosyl transferase [Acidimicrobiia bacterium]